MNDARGSGNCQHQAQKEVRAKGSKIGYDIAEEFVCSYEMGESLLMDCN